MVAVAKKVPDQQMHDEMCAFFGAGGLVVLGHGKTSHHPDGKKRVEEMLPSPKLG